ncbi:MAG: NAD(+) diphosphatase [Rhodobacteraceae bacterium]|nr:NAD(+) diphosphatase [Paracoccaceae bacterium]
MWHAETVTFGGSGLERAAELRGNAERLAELQATGEAIALWRGKPLFDFESSSLIRLKADHTLLQEATEPPPFLGLDGEIGLFAYDVSPWQDSSADAEAMALFFDPSQNRYPGFSSAQVFVELRSIMAKLSPQDAELAATARSLFEWHHNHPFCSKCGAASEVAQSGWQRTCPACGAFHFPRTDPVVIVLATHGNSVLLGRSPNWPEGMYSLLAGFMEPGETMEAAARREVFEESGIRLGKVGYLASQPWPFPSSLMIGCSAEALNTDITIDPKEIEDARWFTREQVVAATVDENSALKPARKGSIAHFLIHNWLSDTLA